MGAKIRRRDAVPDGAPGAGAVSRVEGLRRSVRRRLGDRLVDSRLPRVGGPKSHTYTGDGLLRSATPRRRCTSLPGLHRNGITVIITIHDRPGGWTAPAVVAAEAGSDRRLCRPAWDDDSLPRVGDA